MRQEAALRRMMRRVGMPGRDYLRLSKCAAVCTYFGDKRFKTELAAPISRSTIAPDDMWADALASCRALNASRLRARLYRDPALAPPPGPRWPSEGVYSRSAMTMLASFSQDRKVQL
jgi:hypothetical protein